MIIRHLVAHEKLIREFERYDAEVMMGFILRAEH